MKNGLAITLSSQRHLKGTVEVTDFSLEILVFSRIVGWGDDFYESNVRDLRRPGRPVS